MNDKYNHLEMFHTEAISEQPLQTVHTAPVVVQTDDGPNVQEHPPRCEIPLPILTQPMPGINTVTGISMAPAVCPPGLEYLATIDQLLVHQKIEILEIITGFETQNKFRIRNILGQDIFYAKEDSDCFLRNCCGPLRPYDMKIFDNFRNEVIHLSRPLACGLCCIPCCLQSMEVFAPPGTLAGLIEQEWSCCIPTFAVKNPNRETVLRIESPCCTVSCGGDVDYIITSADGSEEVGKISKQWSGLAQEAFTDADNFSITFPMDLDVRMKAVMLGACILIDSMFYEKKNDGMLSLL